MIRVALTLSLACVLLSVGAAPLPQPAPQDPAASPVTDLHGDDLPPGALARLGTVRFRHVGPVAFVALTPNGKSVISSSGDGAVHLWDAVTGKLLRRIEGHVSGASTVSLAPDGRSVALVGPDAHLRSWDLGTGKQLRKFAAPIQNFVRAAFSADGNRAAILEGQQSLRVWDLRGDRQLWELHGAGLATSLMALSPDGKLLALAAGNDGVMPTFRLWDVDSGQEVPEVPAPASTVRALAFAPDGKLLALADAQGLSLRDATSGREVRHLAAQAGGAVAFSPDGKVLALGNGSSVDLVEVASGKALRRLTTPAAAHALAFAADGKTLVVGGADHIVRLWDTTTGKELLQPPGGHQGAVMRAVYSPDGRAVATAGADGTIRLWERVTGKELRVLTHPPDKEKQNTPQPLALTFLDGGRALAAAWADGTLCVWEAATGKQRHHLRVPREQFQVAAFSPDGALLASVAADGMLRVRDVTTGREWPRFARRKALGVPATVVAFAHDGRSIAIGYAGLPATTGFSGFSCFSVPQYPSPAVPPIVQLVELASACERDPIWPEGLLATGFGQSTPQLPGTFSQPAVNPVTTLVFSPDGKTLAVASDGGLRLWDLDADRERHRIASDLIASPAVAFTPDGKVLATASYGTLALHEARTGERLCEVLTHQGLVTAFAFAPDGKTLVTGSADTTALVWDVQRLLREGRRPAELSPKELEKLWAGLGDKDAREAYRAARALAAVPKRSVPFLAERLKLVPLVGAGRLTQLVADLDSARYATRQQAERELQQLGDLAEPVLRRVLAAKPSLETRRRIEALLERVEGPLPAPEPLRSLRAVELLERIGTTEARQVLQRLASGEPQALLTREARASLQRLARATTSR